ncbi:hypothetical protein HWV62_22078 [Athelia sp. TMB]|nr:hypothetical protein HWV62_22078 [Athelia sp. TMB]
MNKMNTRSTNADKHPGLVDLEPKAPRRTPQEAAAERQQKAATKEQRTQAKASQAQRLEQVVADASAEDASYATPAPPRSRGARNALSKTESFADFRPDAAGEANTTSMPPPPAPARGGGRKTTNTVAKLKAGRLEDEESNGATLKAPKVNSSSKAGGAGTTGSKRNTALQDERGLGGRTSKTKPADTTLVIPTVNDEVAPADSPAEPPKRPTRPRPPPKNMQATEELPPSNTITRQPAPSGGVDARRPPASATSGGVDTRRPLASATTSKASKDNDAKIRGRAEAASREDDEFEPVSGPQNPDDSMTEDDSQAPEYVAPPQTKRDMTSRSAGYGSHTEDHEQRPKKKAKAASAKNGGEERSGGEIKSTGAKKMSEAPPRREVSEAGTVREKLTLVGKRQKKATTPDVGSHQIAVNDKMKGVADVDR